MYQTLLSKKRQFTCVSPCWPAAVASLGTAVMIFPGVPVVITFVVRIVMGVFIPALLVTPARTNTNMNIITDQSLILNLKVNLHSKCQKVCKLE